MSSKFIVLLFLISSHFCQAQFETATSTAPPDTTTIGTSTMMQTTTIPTTTIPTSTIPTTTSGPFPCPFDSSCYCDGGKSQFGVWCQDVKDFPSFTAFYLNGYNVSMQISGNISYIPPNCLADLLGMDEVNFAVTGEGGLDFPLKPLFIDPEAFNGVYSIIRSVQFQQFAFAVMPTKSLSDMTSLSSITFDHCDVPYISDFSFSGVSCYSFTFQYTNLLSLEQHAFDGLIVAYSFALTHNPLQNISTAFQKIKVPKLDLSYNAIFEILDYSFSACNTPNCSNVIEILDLSYNPIQFISNNAFANLPQLTSLSLQHCKLAAIPTYSLISLPNLVWLSLSDNVITFVATNSFYKQHILTTLQLDGNPVAEIETGAFNGLTSFRSYSINDFAELANIDVLVTYGMSSLVSLSFSNCPSLTDLYLTDYTKIPLSLQSISANYGLNLSAISSDLQYWLSTSNSRILDISNNGNFSCNPTIQWMTRFINCNPVQLRAVNTICAGTKQSLISYLQQFQANCN